MCASRNDQASDMASYQTEEVFIEAAKLQQDYVGLRDRLSRLSKASLRISENLDTLSVL